MGHSAHGRYRHEPCAQRLSRPACLRGMITSGRWEQHGALRTVSFMWAAARRLLFGTDPGSWPFAIMVAKTDCIVAVFAAPRPGESDTPHPSARCRGCHFAVTPARSHRGYRSRKRAPPDRVVVRSRQVMWCCRNTLRVPPRRCMIRRGFGERMAALRRDADRAKRAAGMAATVLPDHDLRDAAVALKTTMRCSPRRRWRLRTIGPSARTRYSATSSGALDGHAGNAARLTLGWPSCELSTCWDVDRPEDLDRPHRHHFAWACCSGSYVPPVNRHDD
jgi:hypothetical protein